MDTTAVRCQQDHLFSSQTYRVFESDLLSFDLVLPIYWLSPSHCWVGPNLSLTQSFSFFWVGSSLFWLSPSHYWVSPSLFWVRPSVFRLSPSRFFESDLLSFDSVLPIYWVSSSHCWVGPSMFWLSLSPFFWDRHFLFWLSPSHSQSPSFPIFFTASFPLFPALRSDLIAIYTVDKISDGGVCRKRLPHHLERKNESLARESDQENTKRQE